MDRIIEPVTFKDLVEADLRRAARLVIKIQDEIDPQFRIATPEGDYWIAVQLPSAENERQLIFEQLAIFMAWKRALAFTIACELLTPDCVWCCGIPAWNGTRAWRGSRAPRDRGPQKFLAQSNGCRWHRLIR